MNMRFPYMCHEDLLAYMVNKSRKIRGIFCLFVVLSIFAGSVCTKGKPVLIATATDLTEIPLIGQEILPMAPEAVFPGNKLNRLERFTRNTQADLRLRKEAAEYLYLAFFCFVFPLAGYPGTRRSPKGYPDVFYDLIVYIQHQNGL